MPQLSEYQPLGQPTGYNSNLPVPNMTLITMFGDTTISNDTYINEYSAMTVPGFWRAINFLSSTCAQFGIDTYRTGSDGFNTVVPHPVTRLLTRNISDVATPFSTFQTWFHHKKVWGNGYLFVKRDKLGGKPIALFNLNPEITFPFIYDNDDDSNDALNGTKWYYVRSKYPRAIPANDVLHIHGLGFDGLRGYPLVQLMRQSLEVGKYAERYSADYFKKGTIVRGSLSFPGALTDAQMATIRESARAYNGVGGDKAGTLMVVPFGGKLENGTIENQTSQLIETRRWSVIEIAQITDVPPHILFELSHGKWSNTQQLGEEVVKYTIQPDLVQASQEINAKLFSEQEQEQGYFAKYNTDSLTKADPQTYQTSIMGLVNGGMMIPNYGCKLLDLPSLGPEGDKLRLPSGGAGVQAATQTNITVPDTDDAAADDAGDDVAPDATAPGDQREPTGGGTLLPENAEIDPEAAPPSYASQAANATQATGTVAFETVIEPLLSDVCERVETKTAKAFEKKADKPQTAVTAWANVFAAEQAKYVQASFAPLRAIALQFGKQIDVDKIANRYEMQLKRFAAGEDKVSLEQIAKELINDNK